MAVLYLLGPIGTRLQAIGKWAFSPRVAMICGGQGFSRADSEFNEILLDSLICVCLIFHFN